MNLFEKLERGYSLFDGDYPLSGVSDNEHGCIALVFENKAQGEKFIDDNQDGLIHRRKDFSHLIQVKESFEFMRTCAKNGLAGIELFHQDGLFSFCFGNRIEESGIELPTLTMSRDYDKNNWQIKSRFQEFTVEDLIQIKPWKRYDILDKVSAGFAQKVPFGNWNKMDFFEIRANDALLTLFHVPCLGNWNAISGSVPFFSNTDLAIDFLRSKKNISHLGLIRPDQSEFQEIGLDISALTDCYRIIRIEDLRKRLSEISRVPARLRWVINPNATRDSQVYGDFLISAKEIEASADIHFHGISADWKLLEKNRIGKKKIRNSWNGNDTFYWNAIDSFKLSPLNRSFSSEIDGHKYSGLSSSEIEEMLALYFVESDANSDLEDLIISLGNELEKLQLYTIICWDSVSGEGGDYPLFFSSIFDLIKWLWVYNCVEDHPARLEGTNTPFSVGIVGSRNIKEEQQASESFKLGLQQIMNEIIQNGYQPKYSRRLSALANQSFRSLHIDTLGYCSDLIWQLDGEERKTLLNLLQINEDTFEEHINDEGLIIDVEGKDLAIQHIGLPNWELLSRRSKHFITSSFSQLKLLGSSPQLDFSLVSIGFVKALEFEMTVLMHEFLKLNNIKNLDFNKEDRNEVHLMNLAKKKNEQPLTLGSYSYLLNPNKRNTSELRNALIKFIESLNGGEYFTSRQFWKKDLNKIRTKYRNSGAHDASTPESVCREALNMIVGTFDDEGVLIKVIKWKVK